MLLALCCFLNAAWWPFATPCEHAANESTKAPAKLKEVCFGAHYCLLCTSKTEVANGLWYTDVEVNFLLEILADTNI